MERFDNKRILVMGMGRSGIACARFLNDRGGEVTVTDSADASTLASAAAELRGLGIAVEMGRHSGDLFTSLDLIVISPGVPHTLEPLEEARRRGIPVIGEIELACRFIGQPIVAVTGTNGKTTTTTLLGRMIEASGLSTFVGGNIGTPLIEYVAEGHRRDRVVAEVSSFQLDTIERFRPKVGVLLNITPDHLDRYDDMAAYTRSKGRLFENQSAEDIAILNGGDPAVLSMAARIAARKWFFNPSSSTDDGIFLEREALVIRIEGSGPLVVDISATHLTGKHNLENIAAAALATLATGGSVEGIMSALADFRGLPHRLEYVATVGGVRYFDDSKGTNTDAVVRALDAFENPVVLIMGGRDKGGGYGDLRAAVKKRVKHLVLIGEAREAIARELGDCCAGRISKVTSMEAAVQCAHTSAEPGDVVLLSPACASFDMFKSYAHRGEVFCRAVAALSEDP